MRNIKYKPIQKVVTASPGVEETATALISLYLPLRTSQIRSKYAEMSRANQEKYVLKKKKKKSSKLSVSEKMVHA